MNKPKSQPLIAWIHLGGGSAGRSGARTSRPPPEATSPAGGGRFATSGSPGLGRQSPAHRNRFITFAGRMRSAAHLEGFTVFPEPG